jgi:uncharacterized protein YjbI with pentapeptide repeats
MLVLVTMCGCGLMGFVRALTMEDIETRFGLTLWRAESLLLSNEGFSGPIPPELGKLTNLTDLDLSGNNFSGPIPPELGNLSNLESLNLGSNSLSGPIPSELGSLTSLQRLYLYDNSFSGPIPPKLGTLKNLTLLNFSNNSLSGLIPPELGRLINLEYFLLPHNILSGRIPLNLSRLAQLYWLDLSNNSLSGPIPQGLSSLAQLQRLDLSHNSLSGHIPPELGNTDIFELHLSSNNLSGPIPPELGNLPILLDLDLSNNNLSGPIPPELGRLVDSQGLNLSFTDAFCKLPDLSHLGAITALGLPCSPPLSFKNTNISYLTLTVGNQFKPTTHLDLSSVPDTCRIVNLTGPHPHLESIRFWGGCDEGCIVNLVGTGAKLSRSTRKTVCLSRISVFLLGGDIPFPVYDNDNPPQFTRLLKNQQGMMFNLSDPNFVDLVDLGPEGVAYTGVGFSKVQAGNLCGNPEAKKVTALVYGLFAVAWLVATIFIVVVGHWRRRVWGSGGELVDGGSNSR